MSDLAQELTQGPTSFEPATDCIQVFHNEHITSKTKQVKQENLLFVAETENRIRDGWRQMES